jgi:murein DD-endopeptidase MepM/ murein hydrolase activator NlpD
MSVLTAAARLLALAFATSMLTVSPVFAGGIAAPQRGDRIDVAAEAADAEQAETPFHAMFVSWKKLDSLSTQGGVAVPSARPVNTAKYTSAYGVRSDPFRGSAAMHAGIDLAAPQGTPVYATADGIVARSEWSGGYGNLVEVDHGKGIQTRFGHLSRTLVRAGERVKRGQLIALMGSTGRSTGSHLHYEVRIDGRAVNPVPFLQSPDYVLAMEARTGLALGGPDDGDTDID